MVTVAIAVSLHSSAIFWTLFRLWYKWSESMAFMWWDDAWVVVALFADAASLIFFAPEQYIPGSKIVVESAHP